MKTARQLLAQKGNRAISVEVSASVYDALLMMAEHDIGALLVMVIAFVRHHFRTFWLISQVQERRLEVPQHADCRVEEPRT